MFFDVVVVSYMTTVSGFKMAAHFSNWLVCDVIVTSLHVVIDTS